MLRQGVLSLHPRVHLSLGPCYGVKLHREADPVQARAMLWQMQGIMSPCIMSPCIMNQQLGEDVLVQ